MTIDETTPPAREGYEDYDELQATFHRMATGREVANEPWPVEQLDALYEHAPMMRSRLNLMTAAQFLALPPPTWAVSGMIQSDSLVAVIGPSGSGKTHVVLSMLQALDEGPGALWLGHQIIEQRRALYVVGEGASGVVERVKAHNHHSMHSTSMMVNNGAVDLSDRQTIDALIEAMQANSCSVIVFDTLARCMVGADENSALDVGLIVAQLDRIKVEIPGAIVVLVHHTGKDADKGGRGSSALLGAIDTEITVTRGRMRTSKQKNADELEATKFELVDSGPSVVPVVSGQRDERDLEARNVTMMEWISDVLREAEDSGTVNDLKGLSKRVIGERLRKAKRTHRNDALTAALEELEATGHISKAGTGPKTSFVLNRVYRAASDPLSPISQPIFGTNPEEKPGL